MNNPINYIDELGLDTTSSSPNPSRPSVNLPNAADAACGLVSVVESMNQQQQQVCDQTHQNNSNANEQACDNAYDNCARPDNDNWPGCLPEVRAGCERRQQEELDRDAEARRRVNLNYPVNTDVSGLCDIISP